MYCPQCLVEYRDGFTECSDCRVALNPGVPPLDDTPDPFDPNLDLVVVLETNDEVLLAMATGLLKEAGIPYYVLNRIATLIQDVDGFLHKWGKLQVPKDSEAEARQLLEQLALPAEDLEGAES